MKFPVVWNLLNREITGSTDLEVGWTHIPPLVAQPGSITAYFEAVCKNANASAQDLYLMMSSDNEMQSPAPTAEKTLSIAGSTSSYTRFRSTSFTLDVDYQIKGIQPNSEDLSIISARVITIVDTGSEDLLAVQCAFPIVNYQVFDYSDTVRHDYIDPIFWRYDENDWSPPLPMVILHYTYMSEAIRTGNTYTEVWSYSTPSVPVIDVGGTTQLSEDPSHSFFAEFVPTNGLHPLDGLYYGVRGLQTTSMRGFTVYNGYLRIDQKAGSIRAIFPWINYGWKIQGGTSGTREAAGVSFTTIGAIDVRAMTFGMVKIGSPTDNLHIEIHDALDGSVITNGTSGNVDSSKISCDYATGSVLFNFSTPPSLDAATKYYAKVFRSGSRDTANCVEITQTYAEVYLGGHGLYKDEDVWYDDDPINAVFSVIATGEKIEKFQLYTPLINDPQSGTGLQDFINRYDPAEWSGVSKKGYHEHYTDYNENVTKLQEDPSGTPADIANSDITGQYFARETYLKLIDKDDQGANHRYVWTDGTYIYTSATEYIYAHSFDGSTLTFKDGDSQSSQTHSGIWGDGDYIFVAHGTSGLRAYSFNGTVLTHIDRDVQGTDYYAGVFGNDSYIFVGCNSDGLRAYSFNGSVLTHIDVDVQGTDDYSGVWCDNDYIFVACGTDGLRAYSFNGSTLTHIDSDFQSGDYISVHGYGSYIFVGTWDGIRAYSFNGSTLTHLDFYQTDDLHRGIYHDGTYLFVTGDATGIEVFTFDGSNFVRLSTEHIKGDQFGIHGDGTYVFAGVYTYGLAAYGYASEMTLPSTAKDIDSYIVSVA